MHHLLPAIVLIASALPAAAQAGPDQWNEPAGLPFFIRNGSAMVTPDNDHIYVLPGCDQYGSAPQNFYRYTVSTQTWTPASGPGSLAPCPVRSWYGASMTHRPGSDEIYLLPGGNKYTIHRYSITANTWTPATSPGVLAVTPFYQHYGCALAATPTTVYALAGGSYDNGQRFFAYTPATNTWTAHGELADVPTRCFRGGAMVYPGGDFLYAFSGDLSQFFYRFAINAASGQAAGTWKELANLPDYEDLGASLVVGPGGSLLALSGSLGGMPSGDQRGFFRFDISLGQANGGAWTRLAPLPGTVGAGAAIAWTGGDTVHITRGGEIVYMRSGTVDFWRYSISANRFAGLAPSPGLLGDGTAATGVGDGDSIYVMQGGNGSPTGMYRYSAGADAWTSLSPAPNGVYGGGSLASTGQGLIFGTGSSDGTRFWRYAIGPNAFQQVVDTWADSPDILEVPSQVSAGGGAIWTGGDYLYVNTGYSPYYGSAGSKCYRYQVSTNTWDDDAFADTTFKLTSGTSAWDGGDRIYQLKGEGYRDFYAYTISTNSWGSFDPQDFPSTESIGSGSKVFYPGSGRDLYVLRGYADGDTTTNQLWTYRFPSSAKPAGEWIQRASAPGTPHVGSTLSYPGAGKYLYVTEGNSSATIWRYWMPSDPPNAPTSLTQSTLNGRALPEGAGMPQTGFRASGIVTDPDGDQVRLAIEMKPVGTAFDGHGLFYGNYVAGGQVSTVIVPAGTLAVGTSYHWRAFARDSREVLSTTSTSFGTNSDPDGVDFRVRTNAAPEVSSLRQAWASDGAAVVASQPRFSETAAFVSATLVDPDDVDENVVLEVEVRPAGQAFEGVATHASSPAAGPSAQVRIPVGEGKLSWQCRAGDEWGAFGPWVEFGTGSEADIVVARFGSISAASSCLGSAGSGISPWALGALLLLLRRRRT